MKKKLFFFYFVFFFLRWNSKQNVKVVVVKGLEVETERSKVMVSLSPFQLAAPISSTSKSLLQWMVVPLL